MAWDLSNTLPDPRYPKLFKSPYDMRLENNDPNALAVDPDEEMTGQEMATMPDTGDEAATMPDTGKEQTNLEAVHDQTKPAGMLSRIKDFFSDQANQFVKEQTGTEAPDSSTPMGRVLRAAAGGAVIGAIGGRPALEAGEAVTQTVRNLMQQRALQKQMQDQKAKEDAKEALEAQKTQSEIDVNKGRQATSLAEAQRRWLPKPVNQTDEALKQARTLNELDQIKNRNKTAPKIPTPRMPAKEFHYDAKNQTSTPDMDKYYSAIEKDYIQPLVDSLRQKDIIGKDIVSPGTARQYFDGAISNTYYVPPEDRDYVRERFVQALYHGAPTPSQGNDIKTAEANANGQNPGFVGQVIQQLPDDVAANLGGPLFTQLSGKRQIVNTLRLK